MKPLVYQVTKHTIPGWEPFHDKEPRGIAYETGTHFVHLFGKGHGLWTVSTGLTVTEARSGTLVEWIDRVFGATDVQEADREVGHTVQGVWRPGLYYQNEILQALSATEDELRLAEQALLLLIQRLDEILNFVEPSPTTLQTHSHKARELLILAATEIENSWKAYLKLAGAVPSRKGFTTNDYVKLLGPLYLADYEISLPRYTVIKPVKPFGGWTAAQPTKSLSWYDAYNKTKHDRGSHFNEATLLNCILAVGANLALFSARYGPFRLYQGGGTLAAYFNQLFAISLAACSPRSFYAPEIVLPPNQRRDLICFGAQNLVKPREIDLLVI